jgi:hypothetical protein
VLACIGTAVAIGQLVGWLLPGYLSPILAGALPYLAYFTAVFSSDAPWAVRSLIFDEMWAPYVVPDVSRVVLGLAVSAASAVVLVLTTSLLLRADRLRPLMVAASTLAALVAALAAVPAISQQPYYATVGDRPPRCTTTKGVDVCVLATDADLLPKLTAAVARYLDANGAIPGAPGAVAEIGVLEEPGTWNVGSDELLQGVDEVVRELAAQHVSPTTNCPSELPTPEGANGPWSWLVADLLARQAGVEPPTALPPALARLSEKQARAWLWGATALLRSCHAPTMP